MYAPTRQYLTDFRLFQWLPAPCPRETDVRERAGAGGIRAAPTRRQPRRCTGPGSGSGRQKRRWRRIRWRKEEGQEIAG